MIRINLLPQKQKRRTQPGQDSALVGLIALVIMAGACYWYNGSKQAEIEAIQKQDTTIEQKIAAVKATVGDIHQLEAEKADLEGRAAAIKNLTENRQLPCWAMHELSKLMTKDQEPSYVPSLYAEIQRRDPAAAFDPAWDPKALWLTKFSEKDHKVDIEGGARSQDDVAELVKRLSVSVYFSSVTPPTMTHESAPEWPNGPTIDYYAFTLTARVNY